jgi:hypothetical protein
MKVKTPKKLGWILVFLRVGDSFIKSMSMRCFNLARKTPGASFLAFKEQSVGWMFLGQESYLIILKF